MVIGMLPTLCDMKLQPREKISDLFTVHTFESYQSNAIRGCNTGITVESSVTASLMP